MMVMEGTWPKKKYSLFVSYSRKDKALIEILTKKLRTKNVPFWIDYKFLDLEKPLRPQIELAIKESNGFVLLNTKNARTSSWVQFENKIGKNVFNPNDIYCLNNEQDIHDFITNKLNRIN